MVSEKVFREYLRIEQLSEVIIYQDMVKWGSVTAIFCEKQHCIGAKFLGDYIVGLIPLFLQMGL